MKLSLISPRLFARLAASTIFVATATTFAACSADGDLKLGTNDDAGAADAAPDRSAPLTDAGDDAPGPTTSLCGNRKIDPGEECDDGDTSSNDGCSAACKIESAGPADACSGAPVNLVRVDATTLYKGSLTGTTAGLYNHYSSSCGGGSGADAVYRIDPPMTGRATARITAGFSAIVSVRTSCSDSKTELGCADDTSSITTGRSEIAFPVFQGAPVFVFVDGYGGSGGDFTLDVDVQTAVCGNGKAEFPEGCDDGDTADNDGCSATCELEDMTTKSACPGMPYRLGAGPGAPGKVSFAGDTSLLEHGGGSATSCTNGSGASNSGSGPNAVYAITPTVSGNLSLELLANYPNALLHVRRECSGTENDTQADCAGAADALVPLKTSLPVTAERTVYVFVDSGNTSAHGLYTLDATLTVAACGNGLLDSGEECDDGNTNDGDGCSATCTALRDPSTYTCPGKLLRLEGAAPGPRSLSIRGTTAPLPGETLPDSKSKSCGADKVPDVVYQVTSDIDGWAIARVKGVFNSTLSVRATCTATTDLACVKAAGGTGEEVLAFAMNKETPYFLVVDGTAVGQQGSFELDVEITPSTCGNSVIEGGETCDDGAAASGDGCDDACRLEPPSPHDKCSTAPLTTLEPRAGGTYGTTIVSGNTNLTKEPSPTHSMSPCSSLWADGWYPFTPPISGVVTARITKATFRSTIGVRTGCAPTGTQLTCDDANQKGGQEITFAVSQGTTYWLGVAGGFVVSGKPEIGTFTVDVNLVPIGCGDTFFNTPEQCDDGNTADGDGCSSTCSLETLANVESCPGHAVSLTGAANETRRATVTVDTTGLLSNTGGICGGSGPEGILAITSDIDGLLSIKSTASHAVVLHTRTTCNDPTTEIPSASCGSGARNVNTPIQKNTPYYVYVDGVNGAAGVTKLQITVTP